MGRLIPRISLAILAILAIVLPVVGARGASSGPAFVQQVSAHLLTSSATVTPTAAITAGNRLVVMVGVWSSANATASTVTDSAGNHYVELLHFKASDSTEMSVWSAPITAGGGTKPTITVKPTATADVGVSVSEYSGLSTAADATAVDQLAQGAGKTTTAASVSSGRTPATAAGGELAVGFYVDSGFGDTLTAGSGWTQRTNVSPTSDMEFVTEDQSLASAGATPNASFGTGANTYWLAATVAFKAATTSPPTVPGAPTGVAATAGNASATVSWTAPNSGGSAITGYTITPYVGTSAQTPTTITGSPPATTATITGLTNGTAYSFTVAATNAVGTGSSSASSNLVTPTGSTVPAAPTAVSATAGDGTAAVSWTAPGNGGSAITSYTITPYVGTTARTPTTITGSPPATSATIAGLVNGTTYTFTVAATNSIGTGAASAASNAVTPSGSASTQGQWAPLRNWPIVAVHSILLGNGNVLQWDGWQQPEPTDVWNPVSNVFTTQTAPDSIFCAGVVHLPDGRVMEVGGYGGLSTGKLGIVDTSIFDPSTGSWTRMANMHSARWYPSLVELANGNYVAISGNSTDAATWADTPEVYDPAANTWTALPAVNTSQVHEEEYPFSYLVPNGNVFTIGPSEDNSFLLDTTAQTWRQVGGLSGVTNGSSVMYRPGKILYSGGAPSITNSSSPAQATTAVIDLTAATPAWRRTAPMASARIYHTLTMLADGTALAVGGEPTAGQTGQTEVSGGILPSEIWNPTTETWSTVASTAATRGYHSTALLMPDATVLVAGSGEANPGYPGQTSAQTYSPPYLFKGARPTITSATTSTSYGGTISVTTPNAASIGSVNLVSLGADTHQTDMDQHFVPLSFSAGSGTLSVQAPASGAIAPPGTYMLFIVNANGVPSVASMIHVAASPPTVPGAPTGVTATAGSGSATVSWTAPSNNGGSSITGYTVTPYAGSVAQASVAVTGTPPATSATVGGLTNGTAYTFTVTATNGVGTGAASAPSNAVTPTSTSVVPPAFVQQVSSHATGVSALGVTPTASVVAGDRLIVETGVWGPANAKMGKVADSAGNSYTELLHFTASDGTEMSVWSAPITAGGGTQPTITATATTKADVGMAVLEYSGLAPVTDATVVDQLAQNSGTTSAAATVSSGPTQPTTGANELALGFYADSGFGDTLTAGAGFTPRVNISKVGDMELLAEDLGEPTTAATPNAAAGTGASTIWLMATVVFKPAASAGAASVVAANRTVIGRQTGSVARLLVDGRRHHTHSQRPPIKGASRGARRSGGAHVTKADASFARAKALSTRDHARFVYQALLAHLSQRLLCSHLAAGFVQAWNPRWLF